MPKPKRIYQCQNCLNETLQWAGQCAACQAWNSLIEVERNADVVHGLKGKSKYEGFKTSYAGAQQDQSTPIELEDVLISPIASIPTGLEELDRVLGKGIVAGAVVLLGGDPGIGKSTLLLQMLSRLKDQASSLYVTGEESLQQIAMRAQRLNIKAQKGLRIFSETHLESIIQQAIQEKPRIMVIDSIQTIYSELISGAPGSVTQLRECTAYLTRFAKQTGTALFLTGHVTKEGGLAGPRILEHIVDTVLYFEGEPHQKIRLIRVIKNRFGAVNELGVFAMTEAGLREVHNPSAILLSRPPEIAPGTVVTASWEGNRPLLVELQALADTSYLANPRRVTVGLDHNRLAMLLAVLHRHGDIQVHTHDIFINVVGGIRLSESSGSDLPLSLAILSSVYNRPLPKDLIAFGEVGLSGEIRPVTGGQERLQTAVKHGFKRAIIPQGNAPKKKIEGIELVPVAYLNQALAYV
jgi:DNA repair protein RadA/Sms